VFYVYIAKAARDSAPGAGAQRLSEYHDGGDTRNKKACRRVLPLLDVFVLACLLL
jgi:hypothetical protein